MFFKNLRFLKNACNGVLSNADSPYLGSLTIFVWVMPVSILLFSVGVPPSSLFLAASLSAASGVLFWYQATHKAPLMSAVRRT